MIIPQVLSSIIEANSVDKDFDEEMALAAAAYNALPTLGIEYLDHFYGKPLEYSHSGDAGFDLYASHGQEGKIGPGERVLVPLGIKVVIPAGYEVQIRPRSGLAVNHGITVLNAPGTIDSGYTGEWKVLLINLGHDYYQLKPGDRVCQAVLSRSDQAHFVVVDSVVNQGRGENGFGSTGR